MKTIRVTDTDSTCFEALISRGFSQTSTPEWAAVPDCWEDAIKCEKVICKGGASYIRLLLASSNKTLRIKSFVNSSPEESLAEAQAELAFDGTSENDLEWWQDS